MADGLSDRLYELRRAVERFTEKVVGLRPEEFVHNVKDVQNRAAAWGYKWSAAPGVYVFVNDDKIQYVGKAMALTGLASRAYNQSQPGEIQWNNFLASPSASIVLYALPIDEDVWAPSFECWLINHFAPPQ